MKATYMYKKTIILLCLSPLFVFRVQGTEVEYKKDIKPLIDKYCVSCHGPDKQKAKLRMDTLNPDMINGPDAEMWQEALDLVNISDMPSKKAKAQPTRAERQLMVDWMTKSLRKAMEEGRSTGGRNIMRRLTSYEYNNTLRDLLKLDLRYAQDLPPEGRAKEGFKNNSYVLGTSALHIEYFERIARQALEKVLLVPDKKPQPYFVHVEPELAYKKVKAPSKNDNNKKKRQSKKSKSLSFNVPKGSYKGMKKGPLFDLTSGEERPGGILLAGNRPTDSFKDIFAEDRKQGRTLGDGRSGYQPEFRIEMDEAPYLAPVLIRVKMAAVEGKGGTFPRFSCELGSFRGNNVSDQREAVNMEIRNKELKVYEFIVEAANFPLQSNHPSNPSYFRIFNDFRRGTSTLAYEDLPKLHIDWVEIECNHYKSWPPATHKNILPDKNKQLTDKTYLKSVIGAFMKRAYRRQVKDSEIARKIALYNKLRPREQSAKATLISTLTAILCSPNFLLISEPEVKTVSGNEVKKRPLNNYELANRLAYFLWSSMPDKTLFGLAAEGQLTDRFILAAQVKRMINDPKIAGFTKNFTSQWLDLEGIRRLAVNPEFFKFKEKIKDLFEQETIQFIDTVLKENLSITNFIDSEFVVMNPALARHYRIPGIAGGGFQKIKLDEKYHRGGVITHASMLLGNSTGAETHPIKRGVWLLERLLDDPPPAPPANVPELPEPEEKETGVLSLKERLRQHADVESCNDCHSKIDPWGVAFENYNALGQWREGNIDPLVLREHQEVVSDPATKLNNGKEINNLKDLKSYMLTIRKDQFVKAVVTKVMSYALGRYTEFSDQKAIIAVCEEVKKDQNKFQTLIENVVLSEPFLFK
jgi:hypothetical protein